MIFGLVGKCSFSILELPDSLEFFDAQVLEKVLEKANFMLGSELSLAISHLFLHQVKIQL